ncbi:MFS transporter [Agromyces sp. NPDC056965]|uniref:MFS transporter n=1 Tax=Agromyces sp. NPDC056965 TaxID=3345983 RepID=UPI00363A9D37
MTATADVTTEEALTDSLDPRAKTGLVVAVLAAAGIVVSLAQTLVVPIIASLPEIFATSASNTSWIITVTLLVGAVSTPVMGRLADMYGKKRMLLIAIIPFIVGSVVCALAGDVVTMIIGRGLQGLGSGIIPLGIALLHDVLPKEKAGGAIALMSSSMGIGGALGIPIAAAVAQFADWRVLFWAIGVAAAIVGVAIWRVIPVHEPKGHAHGFDFLGAVGLAVGLVALLLTVSKGAEWGWGSALTIGCFAAAALVLLAWGWYQLRRSAPLIDLRTTAKPVVLLTNIASVLIGFTMYAMNLIVPQVMQLPAELGYGLGQSMIQMGLWIAPMGLGMMAVSNLGAWISRIRGPKVTLTISGVVIAIGYGLVAIILATIGTRAPGDVDPTAILWTLILLLVAMVVTGCGIGLAFGAMPALIMGSVPASEKAAANGFNSLMRSLGTTASAAIIGVVLAAMVQNVGGHVIPTQAGFIVSLLISCGIALVAAVIAAAIPTKAKGAAAH